MIYGYARVSTDGQSIDAHPARFHRPDLACDNFIAGGRCENAGLVLLSESEWRAYQNGQRIFGFNPGGNILKVRVSDPSTQV